MTFLVAYVVQKDQMPYSLQSLNFLEGATLISCILVLNSGMLFYQSQFGERGTNILGILVVLLIVGTSFTIIFVLLNHFKFAYSAYIKRGREAVAELRKRSKENLTYLTKDFILTQFIAMLYLIRMLQFRTKMRKLSLEKR